VRTFLRLVGYYHCFIKDFGIIADPLTKLLWPKATQAFSALQRALTQAPVLQLPAFDVIFIIECDASMSGIDAVLHQGVSPVTGAMPHQASDVRM
jgi:hypothetical protein